MNRSPLTRSLAALLALLLAATTPAAAESIADMPQHVFQIRLLDDRFAPFLDEGMKRSATFRLLVHRINQSDVVVYLQHDTSHDVDGRLSFVAAHAGIRYVLVRIGAVAALPRQIALLAHELRHAVEVAETPSIVDSASLAKAYSGFGYVNHWPAGGGTAFDTQAAVDTGYDVLREVLRSGNGS